jgi:hypothetical protein
VGRLMLMLFHQAMPRWPILAPTADCIGIPDHRGYEWAVLVNRASPRSRKALEAKRPAAFEFNVGGVESGNYERRDGLCRVSVLCRGAIHPGNSARSVPAARAHIAAAHCHRDVKPENVTTRRSAGAPTPSKLYYRRPPPALVAPPTGPP